MNTIYILTRNDGEYAIISNTGKYSWWCDSIKEAWYEFNTNIIGTKFTTIENFINSHKYQNWHVIEIFISDTHPEYFI